MAFNPFAGAFGLHITDHFVKLVRVRTTQSPFKTQFQLHAHIQAPLPAGAVVHGEVVKPQEVVPTIQKIAKQISHRASQNWVVAALPEEKTFIKHQLLQDEKSVDETYVRTLITENIPFSPDELNISWQIIPAEQKNSGFPGLLLSATPKHVADSYTYLLEVAGLSPIALEPASIALARSIISVTGTDHTAAQAILDIGSSNSVFTIFDHHSVVLSRTFSYSASRFEELVANMLNLGQKETRTEIVRRGFNPKHYSTREWSIISRELDYLVYEINRTLAYYAQESVDAREVETIFVCGSGSLLPGFEAQLSGKLKRMVTAGTPWQNLFSKNGALYDTDQLNEYAVAIGLALRAASNPLIKRDDI